MSVQSRVSNPFNPKAAILYGQFVKAAYSMYDPATLTPPPSADFPAGYQLTAWVTMRDFILGSTDPVFYGLIAQSMTDATQFVLAIRGTSNGVEWWDDFNAAIKTPFKVPGCGSVGAGFARIYETLEVIERPTGAATAPAVARSLKPIGGFCQQVAALVRRHVAATPEILGFTHINTLQLYNSFGNVQPSLSCWHALATYLSLIDPTLQPDPDCRLLAAPAVAPEGPAVVAPELTVATPATINLSVPTGPVTGARSDRGEAAHGDHEGSLRHGPHFALS